MKTNNKRIFLRYNAAGTTMLLMLISFSVLTVANNGDSYNQINVIYTFDLPTVEKVDIDGKIYDRVTIEGTPSSVDPGKPCLPKQGVYILIPYGKKVSKITVIPGEKIYYGSGYLIEPSVQPISFLSNKKTTSPIPDNEIYASDNEYPGDLFTQIETGSFSFRGHTILVGYLSPVQYVPASGILYGYDSLQINVETVEATGINSLYRGLARDTFEAIELVDNPEVGITYNVLDGVRKLETEPPDPKLLIITIDEFKHAFQEYALRRYRFDHVRTEVKTLTDVGSNRPEDIRDFIRNQYLTNGVSYVLLGGDADRDREIIPVKKFGADGIETPSDLYYACLDGNFGHLFDDPFAEVYVGRVCADSISEVYNFINKTISYIDTYYISYKYGVVLAGERLDNYPTWGGNYMDQLIWRSRADGYNTIGIPKSWVIDRLYDLFQSWGSGDILMRINDGTHVINHLGHSSQNYSMRLYNDQIDTLTNEKYCFIYSQGCLAGSFDNMYHISGDPINLFRGFNEDDCAAEHFTVETPHGAFAAIMNTRYGYYLPRGTDGPSQRYHRQFWDAVFGENFIQIGKANQDSKHDNFYRINEPYMQSCYYEVTLFGDPSVSIENKFPPHCPG